MPNNLQRMALYYKGLPHQDLALEFIEKKLTSDEIQKALQLYRQDITDAIVPKSIHQINWGTMTVKSLNISQ